MAAEHSERGPVDIEALWLQMDREASRVGVDWDAAQERFRALTQLEERELPGGSAEVTFGLDVTRMLSTLRSLPDGAGTDAFLDAFEKRRPD
jgi:hypothetical protein